MTVRTVEISASILNADFGALGTDVERAAAGGVDSIHLDVMDGHFVPNLTFGPATVAALRSHAATPFHAHLMIEHPLDFVDQFAAAGSDLIVFHLEAAADPAAVIERIHAAGRQAGLALNPETPADAAEGWLESIDLLLVMTVHPGFGGQAFLSDQLPKVRALRALADAVGIDLPIAVDGGVNLATIGSAAGAGASVMVVGSGLYHAAGELGSRVAALRQAAEVGA